MQPDTETMESDNRDSGRDGLGWFVVRMVLAAAAIVAAYALMSSDAFGGVGSHALGDAEQSILSVLTGGKATDIRWLALN